MTGRLISGGAMIPARKARKPPRLISGGAMIPARKARKPHKPPRLISGGAMVPAGARKAPKKRGLARSAASVACCAAEALAASLRLAGGAVADEDVLALYWHTARGLDEGATIEAAADHGLAGVRPLTCECVNSAYNISTFPTPLILGLDLPQGPHFVTDDGEAWWSWGEPFDPASFPHAVIEEAWEVRWAA